MQRRRKFLFYLLEKEQGCAPGKNDCAIGILFVFYLRDAAALYVNAFYWNFTKLEVAAVLLRMLVLESLQSI